MFKFCLACFFKNKPEKVIQEENNQDKEELEEDINFDDLNPRTTNDQKLEERMPTYDDICS